MLVRCYVLITGALALGYVAWPAELQPVPYLLIGFGALLAVLVGVRRAPPGARAPWWVLLAAMVNYNVGSLLSVWEMVGRDRVTADGTAADLFKTAADVLVLVTALVVVVRRGRGDLGGVIDSVITSVALGGLLWDTVMLSALTEDGASTGRQVALFVNVFVLAGTLGAMIRVSTVSAGRIESVHLFTVAIALGLAGNVAAPLAVDDVTGARAPWTTAVFLLAFVVIGAASLHPSAAEVARPGPSPADDLTTGRLAFLGAMLALGPVVGGGRVLLGLPTDGVLIAFSSAGLIPLVMVRIARLSTARREAQEALRRLAGEDTLTGLPNRAACLDHLTAELAAGPRDLAVLFGDLDGFKPVNDRLGHAAGDELLVEVADRLRSCVRDEDRVSRLGGDEFVIVCRGPAAVAGITERIREMVARPFPIAGEPVRIGLSAGVATARPGDSVDDLVNRADLAMYDAKRAKAVGALSLTHAGNAMPSRQS